MPYGTPIKSGISEVAVRFLTVDDDESVHHFLYALLHEYGQCHTALSGEEAVRFFDDAHDDGLPFDVVMMDILMPGIDGHQAAATMRKIEKERNIDKRDSFKLVMITSLVDDINVSKAFFGADASCYIVKPLDKESVLSELKRNLII